MPRAEPIERLAGGEPPPWARKTGVPYQRQWLRTTPSQSRAPLNGSPIAAPTTSASVAARNRSQKVGR